MKIRLILFLQFLLTCNTFFERKVNTKDIPADTRALIDQKTSMFLKSRQFQYGDEWKYMMLMAKPYLHYSFTSNGQKYKGVYDFNISHLVASKMNDKPKTTQFFTPAIAVPNNVINPPPIVRTINDRQQNADQSIQSLLYQSQQPQKQTFIPKQPNNQQDLEIQSQLYDQSYQVNVGYNFQGGIFDSSSNVFQGQTGIYNQPAFQKLLLEQRIKDEDQQYSQAKNEVLRKTAKEVQNRRIQLKESKITAEDSVKRSFKVQMKNEIFPYIYTYPNLDVYNQMIEKADQQYGKYIRQNDYELEQITQQVNEKYPEYKLQKTIFDDTFQIAKNKQQSVIIQVYQNGEEQKQVLLQIVTNNNEKKNERSIETMTEVDEKDIKTIDQYLKQFDQSFTDRLENMLTQINRQVIQKVEQDEYLFWVNYYHLDCENDNCQVIMNYANIRDNNGYRITKQDTEFKDKDIHEHYFLVDYQKNKYQPKVTKVQEIKKDDPRLMNFQNKDLE